MVPASHRSEAAMEAETQVTSDVSDAIGGAGDATTVVGDPTSEASDATSEAGDATSEAAGDATIVERIAQSGQERLQRLSNDLIANPVVSAAMSRAMAAK